VLVVLVSARFTPSIKTLCSRGICGGGGFEAGTGGVTEVTQGRREVMACARSEAAGRSEVATISECSGVRSRQHAPNAQNEQWQQHAPNDQKMPEVQIARNLGLLEWQRMEGEHRFGHCD
jgi:hypothetical protein